MSLIFRAPDLGHLKLGHEVLEKMNERGPAAAAAAALRHLELHPDDPKALQHLIEAHKVMDDPEGESGALLRIIELLPEEEIGVPICRLSELGELKRFSPLKRVMLAEKVKEHSPEAAACLLESVVEEPAHESQRPEAMLALAALKREDAPESAEDVLSRLETEYPLHPAVELARARGWIQ
jgi:hypothetical protein